MDQDLIKANSNKIKTKSFFTMFCEIFSRIPKYRKKQFWLLFMFMLLVSAIETAAVGSVAFLVAATSSPETILSSKYIVVINNIFQAGFLNSIKGIMVFLGCAVIFLIGMKNALYSLLLYCVARFGALIEAHFGSVLFRGFLNMPYQWHMNRNSADIILALQWRNYIGHTFFNTSLTVMNDIILVLFLALATILVNPYISITVIIVFGVVGYLIYGKIHHLLEREARKCRQFDQSINRQVTKGIHGIKDVKVSGKASFLEDFKKEACDLARIKGMSVFFGRLPLGLLETIGFAVVSGAIVFMLFFIKSSSAEVTGFISLLVVAAWRILPAVSRIMSGFNSIRGVSPYIQTEMGYVEDVEVNAASEPDVDSDSFGNFTFDQDIRLKDVFFAYQGRQAYVLKDVSFQIKKGQTVGIVGCSGVGKSTLVDIIIGLLQPNKGYIEVDSQKLDSRNRYAWMRKIGYVPQSPYIFDGTIAENIAFGVKISDIDRNFVLECCQMAYMQDVLDILPQGIDTVIGERGIRLSGGQRQRVAIARSLYNRPEVMIFDEATSSLDRKSEKAIQDTISALKGSRTLLIIAHRLKSVENCDFLVWLESGRVRMADTPRNVLHEYEDSLR